MAIAQRWIMAMGIFTTLAAGALLWAALRADDSAQARPAVPEEETETYIPPAATPEARERRRLQRYDRDEDDFVSYAEYMASRRKAFAKLDRNQDGRLSFEEYAVKTREKFIKADANGDQRLNAAEFATTASRKVGRD